ncbi:ketosteroid isomerase-like protein [Allocatelliglobosispora scoriae]|uniref:Ketosteroid isomerase-like protein n=1 Tax=Allocatelliglobosispora scoriae TaxID=643052 RepID=A0A841C1H3_9ACTN|nr:nuclear transport factor 2 family protein [Allocatelliglobosispora scoriae]MBB5872721.1 ketosteroid isomerase-like protein [Allocatelliglobosispora scoriae]
MIAPGNIATKTMTHGEAMVRRYYECVDNNDVEGLVALFQPDAVYRRPGYPAMVGHAEMAAFYRGGRKFSGGAHAFTAVLDTGTHVAVHGEFAGTLHGGTSMTLRFADFFEVGADGLFSRRDTYYFAPLG